MQMQNWSFSAHLKHTHADKSHWNPKSFNSQIWETRNSHCSTRKVWVELNSQTETRNSHISTRNLQLKLATRTRTRNSNSQLATCNSQLAEYLDPLMCKLYYDDPSLILHIRNETHFNCKNSPGVISKIKSSFVTKISRLFEFEQRPIKLFKIFVWKKK